MSISVVNSRKPNHENMSNCLVSSSAMCASLWYGMNQSV